MFLSDKIIIFFLFWNISDQKKLIKSEKIYGSEHNNQRWYTFTVLGLSCGLRLAELAGKNWRYRLRFRYAPCL